MIKIAIVGMGNLGKACANLIKSHPDMELVATFDKNPRRASAAPPLQKGEFPDVDIVLICVGSQTDAPMVTPELAKHFSTKKENPE